MMSISHLSRYPAFARFFAMVHPLFWPILWWQLNRLARYIMDENPGNVLYSVNAWGIVRICYIARGLDPDAYKPLPRTFRPLTDASWESALPACLGSEAPHTLILPRTTGACRDQRSHGDRPGKESRTLQFTPNTS